jgi:hypothetical protein
MTILKRLLLLSISLSALVLITCSSPSSTNECNDGIDNDGDMLVDGEDPNCADGGTSESGECEPGEPGCNEGGPACSDGVDNDGDGKIDFPEDPGCALTLQDSEEDDCPDGEKCPECGNGIDDDGDGDADFPEDLGCSSASDSDEFNATPDLCGADVSIQPLPDDNMAVGQIVNDKPSAIHSPGCGGSGQEVVYIMDIEEPTAVSITTDFQDTNIDTVLYVRSNCAVADTEIGCNDDAGNGILGSTLFIDRLEPGKYNIVIDTHTVATAGPYHLEVDEFVPQGEECTEGGLPCAPGLHCRLFNGMATTETCEMPECNDGQDNVDGDGLGDFPDDPGCSSILDNDESDDCPSGPNCPQCSNDSDDDGDGLSDYDGNGGQPDPGCEFAADNLEIDECAPGVPLLELTDAGTSGNTEPSGNSDFSPSCHGSSQSSEDEYAYFNTRNLKALRFSTIGSTGDTVLHVRYGSCGNLADEVACFNMQNGGEEVEITSPVANDYYYVFVDGDYTPSIAYVLNVSGTLATGAACDAADTQFVCDTAAGESCMAGTCSM